MYLDKYYNNVLKPIFLIQNNGYNSCVYRNLKEMLVSIQLNSFSGDKNLKIIKLFFLLFFITHQKPFMKKIKFSYVKKQILKKFFFIVNLRGSNFLNFCFYLSSFYFFYFNIYFLKPVKYNYNDFNLFYYLDNIQTQFKNYPKLNIKSQIKVTCGKKLLSYNQFIKLLNCYASLNINKQQN